MCDFNPRTHEGCDAIPVARYDVKGLISIHAPMKGATKVAIRRYAPSLDFNPRTHEGCDSLQINSVIACFSIIYIAN